VPLEARIAEALAMVAEAVRGAILGARTEERAIFAFISGKAEATAAPAEPPIAALMRTHHLQFARLACVSRFAQALATLALATSRARGTTAVHRAAPAMCAILAAPSCGAEAAADGAHALRLRAATERTGHLLSAVLAEVAWIAEAAPMLARAMPRAVLRALAARAQRTFSAVEPRLTVAPAVVADAVAVAISRAAAPLGAVEARPLQVALAHAVRARAAVVTLVRAVRRLHGAIDAAVAFIARARSAETEAVAGAFARAGGILVACLARPAGLAEARALAANAVARAVPQARAALCRAVGANVPRLAVAGTTDAHALIRAFLFAAGNPIAVLAGVPRFAPALAVHAMAMQHAVCAAAAGGAWQRLFATETQVARLAPALPLVAHPMP
jgi:hypothetical protein